MKIGLDRPTVERTAERNLAQWTKYGDRLDTYILPSDDGRHSAGVRYGPEEEQYLSPGVIFHERVEELLERYRHGGPALR